MRHLIVLVIVIVLCVCSVIPGQRSRHGPRFPTIERDATVSNMLIGDGTNFASVSIVAYDNAAVFYDNNIVTY